MRVLLNCFSAAARKTGIGHYATALMNHLKAVPECEVVPFAPGSWSRPARLLVERLGRKGRGANPSAAGKAKPGPGQRIVSFLRDMSKAWYGWRFQGIARRGSFDIYHEPNVIPLETDLPTVATIPDLSVLLHPQWHPADRVAFYEREFHRTLPRINHFLTISEFARQEIIHTLGIAPSRITRTYCGMRPGLQPLAPEEIRPTLRRLGLPDRYLLNVGTLEPRKNVEMLLRAWCALPAPLRNANPLVLVGGWGWNFRDLFDYFHCHARPKGAIHLGYLADADLVHVYNGARALLFPSFYEGFGLPPLEMMACGGAVVASTAGAHVEIFGQHAPLIDPRDEDGWHAALNRLCLDDDWCQSLRQGSTAFARPFTWDRCASETMAVYRDVLSNRTQRQAA